MIYQITKIKKDLDKIDSEIKEFGDIIIQLNKEIESNKIISICKYIYNKDIENKYVNINLITVLIFLEKYGGFNNIKHTLDIYISKISEEIEYNCFMILLLNSILILDFEKIEKYSDLCNEYFDDFFILKDYVRNNFDIKKYCTLKKDEDANYFLKNTYSYNNNYLANKKKRKLYDKNNLDIIKNIKKEEEKKEDIHNEIYKNNRYIIENVAKIYNKYINKIIDNNLNRFNKVAKIYYEIYKNQKIYESKYIFPYYELENIHINKINNFIKLLEKEIT